MVPSKWRELLTTAVAGILVLLGALPTVASQEDPFRFGLENNNPVFLSREEAVKGGSFRFLIKGGTGATIVAELVDIYAGASGEKTSIPLGSSKFSPKGLITFDNVIAEYRPSSEFQYFDIPFRFTEDQNFDKPVLGGVKISVQTQEANTEGFKVESSVVGTFSYFPVGTKLSYSPSVELSQPLVSGMGEEFPPFGFIPDFPFLFNDGKFTVDYEFENTGDIFLEATSDVVLSGPSLFGQELGEEAFSFSSEKAFLVPNQIATNRVTVAQKVDDEIVIETLPYGVYTLTTSVSGALGSDNKVEDTSTQIIVIFPWKYTLFALFLLVVFRKRIKLAAMAVVNLNRSWREFRGVQKTLKPVPVAISPNRDSPDSVATSKSVASVVKHAIARKSVGSDGQFHLGPVSEKGFATITRTSSVTAHRIRVKSFKDLQSAPIGRRFTLKHNQSRELRIAFNRVSYRTPKITITWLEGFARFETELTVNSSRSY
jgi:hypothetical protein